MLIRNLLICFCCLLAACSQHIKYKNPHVKIETGEGDIELELYPDQAPKTVAAFLSYVDSGYYVNSNFYRVWNDDNQAIDAYKARLIQGGIWETNHKLVMSLPGIPHETTAQTGIQHINGVISLARGKPGTASTEFFICVGNQHGFDYGGKNNTDGLGYAAFGRVVKGMEVVIRIYRDPEKDEYFDPPIALFNIVRM